MNEEYKEEKIDSLGSSSRDWSKVSRYILMVFSFLLPFWVLPWMGFSLSLNKSILIYIAVLSAAIFYLLHILQKGAAVYLKNWSVLSLLALLFVFALSSFFSGSFSFSALGAGNEISTFSFVLTMAVLLFLFALLFTSERHILTLLFLFTVSSLVVFIFQVSHTIFGYTPQLLSLALTDGLVGSWNELAIFFGLIALMNIVFLEFFSGKLIELSRGRQLKKLLYISIFISLLTMAFVNFITAWVVLGSLLLVLIVCQFSFSHEVKLFSRLPFFIVLVSLFFVFTSSFVGDLINSMNINSLEVRPSWTATFSVIKETLGSGVKNLFLGSGPNTFVYDWMKFKPVDINQTIFWSARFMNGIGLLPSFVATTGILGGLSWLFFLLAVLYYGLKAITYTKDNVGRSLLICTFLASAYLWVFSIIYVPGHVLFCLTFLVTGLFFALLSKAGIMKLKEISFVDKSTVGFVSSLAIVLLLISGVASFYLFFQKYWAVYFYRQGIIASNVEGNLDKAENYINRAARFDKQDSYYRSLSEVGLLRINNLLSQQNQLTKEELLAQFQNLVGFSVQNARTAASLNPSEPLNWVTLGQVYENLVSFKIQGSREIALEAYKGAMEKSPLDPQLYLSCANVELRAGDVESARKFINSALELKNNYTNALFLLAKISAQEGDLDDAIKQTELALFTAPGNTGVLFQLGLLYYQKEDFKNVVLVLDRAVGIDPNYSNARYFLGLAYDKLGKKESALAQFKEIQALNPDNAEVKKIIANLEAGRSALSAISPPEVAPEDREEPPIKDKKVRAEE